MNILVIGGHPADVFDHAGGTMAHHVRRGDKVTCLALTQGLRIHDKVVSEIFRFGIDKYTPEEIDKIVKEREAVKYQEVKNACAILGVTDVRFLSYDDKMLQVTMELINEVAKVIRDVRPDLIITHYPRTFGNVTNHHGNAAKIAQDAAALAGTVDFEDPNPAWRVPQFAYMLNGNDTTGFNALDGHSQARPNYFVNVEDVLELKVKALDAMVSQQYDGPYARKRIEATEGNFGFYVALSYAEAYMLKKPKVDTLLRIPEHWLTRANEPELTHIQRDTRILTPNYPYESKK